MFQKPLCVAMLIITGLFAQAENSCLECHGGIEPIRDHQSKMMQEIFSVAKKAGAEGNDCVVCHGGNPNSLDKDLAHEGTLPYFKEHKGPKAFYPYPGSPWINEHTCGMCHEKQVSAQENNLMATEQGKIHGALWGFGAKDGYKHSFTNFGGKSPVLHERLGSDIYKKYMEKLAKMEPQGFMTETKELPPAPTAEEVEKDPSLSVYTYLRQECLRCHTVVRDATVAGTIAGSAVLRVMYPTPMKATMKGVMRLFPKRNPGICWYTAFNLRAKYMYRYTMSTTQGFPWRPVRHVTIAESVSG